MASPAKGTGTVVAGCLPQSLLRGADVVKGRSEVALGPAGPAVVRPRGGPSAEEIRLDLPVAGRTIVPVHTNHGGEPMAHALTIGQLAKATGVASKTIRYYEQIGVLPTPTRSAARYRQYDQSGVQRLRFIRRARSLGLPLREIKTLATALDGGRPGLRPRLLALVRQQLSAVQHQSDELQLLQQQLEQVLHRLLTSPHRRHKDGCRCLEVEGG